MASLNAEIAKAEAARKAAADRLKTLRAKERAAAKKKADADALALGRDLLGAPDRDAATAVFKAWRSRAYPEGGERSETDLGTAHLSSERSERQTDALLASDAPPAEAASDAPPAEAGWR